MKKKHNMIGMRKKKYFFFDYFFLKCMLYFPFNVQVNVPENERVNPGPVEINKKTIDRLFMAPPPPVTQASFDHHDTNAFVQYCGWENTVTDVCTQEMISSLMLVEPYNEKEKLIVQACRTFFSDSSQLLVDHAFSQ